VDDGRTDVRNGCQTEKGGESMKRSTRSLVAVLLAVSLSAVLAASADAKDYRFMKIVDSSQGLRPDGCPAINDAGAVAFKAVSDQFVEAIFRADETGFTTIVSEDAAGFSFLGRNPSLNELGQVSFAARLSGAGGEAILVGSGGPLTTIARTEPGEFNFFGFDTSLNNAGEVAFKAELDNFDEGLFVGSGGPVTTVYVASTSQFLGDDSRPSINDAGQIAFEEDLDDFTHGIFLFSGGEFMTIADENSPVVDFAFNPQLNGGGVVVFTAFRDDGEMGVFTGSGGPLATVADTTGPYSFFSFSGPSINDEGAVAFGASLDTGESGIFVGPDPVADRVIMTGERLRGSRVTNVFICSEGLNNAGQIVFGAQFDDGRSGIFVATPKKS
jgi:hypothetical protein